MVEMRNMFGSQFPKDTINAPQYAVGSAFGICSVWQSFPKKLPVFAPEDSMSKAIEKNIPFASFESLGNLLLSNLTTVTTHPVKDLSL